jgi:hypothetical protein
MWLHEHTGTHLSCTTVGCRPNSICKSFNPEYWHQALASLHIHCQARQITLRSHYGETWPSQGHLHRKHQVPRNDTCRTGIKPRPRWWEASTVAKSYSNSVLEHLYMSKRHQTNSTDICQRIFDNKRQLLWKNFVRNNLPSASESSDSDSLSLSSSPSSVLSSYMLEISSNIIQCWGSGSAVFACFWASRIWIY